MPASVKGDRLQSAPLPVLVPIRAGELLRRQVPADGVWQRVRCLPPPHRRWIARTGSAGQRVSGRSAPLCELAAQITSMLSTTSVNSVVGAL